MRTFTTIFEAETVCGRDSLASYDVRLTFTVTAGRAARTWANAADGFHPAEGPTVDITEIEVKLHQSHNWAKVEGFAFDMVSSGITPEWLLARVEADEAAA